MTRIVQSLLALAVSSSVALAQGWSATPGKGLSYDGGDAFSFKMVNQLQTHWTYTGGDTATDTSSFRVRRARTTFSGTAFNKNIAYKLKFDAVDSGAAGDGNIKEGHVQWSFMKADDGEIGLRMGQGKVLYGLSGTQTSSGLFFVERSTPARQLSDEYSRGLWILGKYMDNQLRWAFGAMNGDVAGGLGNNADVGEETANSDHELSYTAMVNFDPLGDSMNGGTVESNREGDFRTDDTALRGTIGVGYAFGNGRTAAGPGGADIESTSLNVNTAWSVANFQVMGEYFMRTDDPQAPAGTDEEEPSGWYASATYVLPKGADATIQWGFGARVAMLETDRGTVGTGVRFIDPSGVGTEADVSEISVVANAFYHGHACKTQIEYTLQEVEPTTGTDATNHIVRVAFQLLF